MTTPTLHHELTVLRAENARLKILFDAIKQLACGDRAPNWVNDMTVTQTRMKIADVCDCAILGNRFGLKPNTAPDPYTTRGFMADEPKNWSEG